MKKVVIVRNYKSYKKGETYTVYSNEAHSLIDGGYAVLADYYTPQPEYPDKMMRPRKRR